MVLNRCPLAPKASGPRVYCARTESNLAVYEAEFGLDLMVGFVAKDIIMNHGEVHDEHLKLISVINLF
jgi:hypothetical protein